MTDWPLRCVAVALATPLALGMLAAIIAGELVPAVGCALALAGLLPGLHG